MPAKESVNGPSGSNTETAGSGKGRVAAALIGGSLLSFALGLGVTIFVPGFDGLDEAFLGGLLLVAVWPVVMLWVLFARTSQDAWKRALIPLGLLLLIDAAGLVL